MRNEQCPLCGSETESFLRLRFKAKMKLPTEFSVRHCALDNFLFVAAGDSQDYDEYYESLANDSYHTELAAGNLHSPIAILQKSQLVKRLLGFFDQPRKVFDFGCGEASLLLELAGAFDASTFRGFDPSPAAELGGKKAQAFGLDNLHVSDLETATANGPYDLIIVSHVLEHLLDFDLLLLLNTLLNENGLLYVEVPNPLAYSTQERREFLYYFDRLHVNHFTPQAVVRLASKYGFGYVLHFEYVFPYRDGGDYPAQGIFFQKGGGLTEISSRSILAAAQEYLSQERARAKSVAHQFNSYDGILVWGAGDNFFRSMENGGPLSGLPTLGILDRCPQTIRIGDRQFVARQPHEGIRSHPWPVVITVSEGRQALVEEVKRIDPARVVFCI